MVVAAEKRTDITVVTPDTADAYYSKQMQAHSGLPPEPVAAAPAAAATPAAAPEAAPADPKAPAADPNAKAEPATEDGEDAGDKAGKGPKNGKLNERFSELTQKRKDAEALAEQRANETRQERLAREAAERDLAALRAKYEPPVTELGPKPDPTKYEDVEKYTSDLEKWVETKKDLEFRKEQAEERARREKAAVQQSWNERLTAARAEIPDYDAVLGASQVVVSDQLRDAILESDRGPWILHHLAENPDVADKLSKLSDRKALIELGMIAAATISKKAAPAPKQEPKDPNTDDKTPLAEVAPAAPAAPAPAPAAAAPAAPVVEISKAPPPVTPLRGTHAPVEVPRDEKGEFKGTYEEWKVLRKAGKIG